MKINANLFPMKAHYFLLFAATAPMLPFLPLFGKQLGLQSGITLIYTILPFAGVIFKVVAGGLADRNNSHKKILLVSMLFTTLGFFSLYFTPSIPKSAITSQSTNVSLDCSSKESLLRHHHKSEPCGRKAYLSTITHQINSTCGVECRGDQASLDSVCSSWGPQHCQSPLIFSTIIDLFAAVKISNDSYLPMLEVTIPFNNTIVEHPTCINETSVIRLHSCQALCDDSELMKYLDAPQIPPTLATVLSYPGFWVFFVLMLVSWSFFASTVTLSDTVCFMLIGRHGGEYGQQRVWGSIGWGFAVMLAGLLIDVASGTNPHKDYTPAFLLTLAFFILDLIVVSRTRIQNDSAQDEGRRAWCMPCDPAAVRLCLCPKVLLFILSCIVVGISTGSLWTYTLMLVEEVIVEWQCDFKWIKLLDGLMLGIQCFVGELPFFLLAGMLLQKLGHMVCMTVVILTFGLRCLLYSVVVNPWFFLPIEVTQGLTFGLFYATMATYASKVALPGTEASMQAILGASFEGIGVALGNAIGGVLFFTYGGRFLFRCLGIFNLIYGVVFCIIYWILNKHDPEPTAYQPQSPKGSTEPISELSAAEPTALLS